MNLEIPLNHDARKFFDEITKWSRQFSPSPSITVEERSWPESDYFCWLISVVSPKPQTCSLRIILAPRIDEQGSKWGIRYHRENMDLIPNAKLSFGFEIGTLGEFCGVAGLRIKPAHTSVALFGYDPCRDEETDIWTLCNFVANGRPRVKSRLYGSGFKLENPPPLSPHHTSRCESDGGPFWWRRHTAVFEPW